MKHHKEVNIDILALISNFFSSLWFLSSQTKKGQRTPKKKLGSQRKSKRTSKNSATTTTLIKRKVRKLWKQVCEIHSVVAINSSMSHFVTDLTCWPLWICSVTVVERWRIGRVRVEGRRCKASSVIVVVKISTSPTSIVIGSTTSSPIGMSIELRYRNATIVVVFWSSTKHG